MRRFWLGQPSHINSTQYELTGDMFHHVVEVCRMQIGNRFELLTTDQMAILVELSQLNKKSAVVQEISRREVSRPKGPRLHLCLSIPKFQTLEAVLEKSVELGVTSIRPFFSDFSFVKSMDKISLERTKRWQKIIQSASQQSNRGDLLVIEVPISLPSLLSQVTANPVTKIIFCYEGLAPVSLGETLRLWSQEEVPHDVFLFIGSEGGFSDREVQLFKQKGFEPVSLGAQVLRVETACVAAVSAVKFQTRAFG